ncbi:Amine oxidase [Madurella fahalii]|uniref:Amine oxidase n=1 Tax=Madurella fahalii TaxID=1157608 RepID=A0ABQ0GA53_9PEZI
MKKLLVAAGLLCARRVRALCPDIGSGAANGVPTISKDVAIIGGGGSGAYSAVRLREDYGIGVVVVEKEPMLGGHVNTWIDPATGRGFEAGVQSYVDLANTKDFFSRMGVSTMPNNRPTQQPPLFVDFSTGTRLSNYTLPSTTDRNDALRRYLALAEKYLPFMEPGWWSFPAPKDIPVDLVLPFRDFVEKYNLTAGVPQIFATTGFGKHDMLGSLTMWVMRSFNVDMARTILGINAGFVPSSGKNQDLYDNILKLLGPDVLLSSTAVRAKRSDKGVVLEVRNSVTCNVTRIVAKKLLFTAPPTGSNLAPLEADDFERGVFQDFNYSTSYVGVVSHPALPRNFSITNVPGAAEGGNWIAAVPKSPFNVRFDNYANSSYYRVVAAGDHTFTKDQAQDMISATFDKMVVAGTVSQTQPPQPLTFHLFESHGLVGAHVSREVLNTGFIQRLNGLQGRRSTWFTGAAWSVHISTSLWVFTDTLLPRLVASL